MTLQPSEPPRAPWPALQLSDKLALWRAQDPKFSALIEGGAPPLKAVRYIGLKLWRDGRLADAVSVMTMAAASAPRDPLILGELGYLLSVAGREAEAKRYLAASLGRDPNQIQIWLTVAVLCKETGDIDTAEQAFLAALALDPNCAEAAAALGLLYVERRRLEDAARLLRAAAARGGVSPPVYACLGQTLYLLGDFSNARTAFEEAARALPDEAGIVRKFAQTRLIEVALESSVEDAIEAYRSIAGRHAEDTGIVCRMAFQALSGYGRREAAIRIGDALLAREPGDPVVRYQLDALRGRAHDRAPSDYLTACFDKYALRFDRHLVEVLDYRIPEKLVPLLVETGRRFSRILDLGCGTGLAAPHLASFGGNLIGVDISPRMIAKAGERNLYDQLIEDEAIAYLSKGEERFDLIAALDVLVYFGDLTDLFAGAARRLAPGGLFAISYETGQCGDYALLTSGRFAHDPAYVERLCDGRFACVARVATMLRLEANQPVEGRLDLLWRM